jgi:hypothetical protein
LPQVSIPKNPSSFAVFAAIRNTCLENKRKQDTILQVSFDESKYQTDDVISYITNKITLKLHILIKSIAKVDSKTIPEQSSKSY